MIFVFEIAMGELSCLLALESFPVRSDLTDSVRMRGTGRSPRASKNRGSNKRLGEFLRSFKGNMGQICVILRLFSSYATSKKRKMTAKIRQGQFEVIESFAIKRRNEFYLIGELKEGTVQEKWFVNVPFNNSLALTLRVSDVEDVEISSEKNKYKLLIVSGDEETIDMLLALNIGNENLDITIEGED